MASRFLSKTSFLTFTEIDKSVEGTRLVWKIMSSVWTDRKYTSNECLACKQENKTTLKFLTDLFKAYSRTKGQGRLKCSLFLGFPGGGGRCVFEALIRAICCHSKWLHRFLNFSRSAFYLFSLLLLGCQVHFSHPIMHFSEPYNSSPLSNFLEAWKPEKQTN